MEVGVGGVQREFSPPAAVSPIHVERGDDDRSDFLLAGALVREEDCSIGDGRPWRNPESLIESFVLVRPARLDPVGRGGTGGNVPGVRGVGPRERPRCGVEQCRVGRTLRPEDTATPGEHGAEGDTPVAEEGAARRNHRREVESLSG
ncbi:hypothetical protein [Halospeciosus flavus]|uniref:Uncharacterized protein n=1 Tax=Halospeciosus flavus TaxID=3032283 RepID=A0ABD5YVV6_9EURY|nr:hypothetical protein [Halospeciosus flavus]